MGEFSRRRKNVYVCMRERGKGGCDVLCCVCRTETGTSTVIEMNRRVLIFPCVGCSWPGVTGSRLSHA